MPLKEVYRNITDEEAMYMYNIEKQIFRGTLIEVHISDIHFGAIDPSVEYKILEDQFLNKIANFKFDLLSIDGDILDHKFMSNSDAVLYANLFVSKCVEICKKWGATLIIIHGTRFHDADQLKLFYHYLEDPNIDMRIVEKVQFEYVKGAKILCIPELYNMGSDYYNKFLFGEGFYDSVFMHGIIKGAVYQARNQESGTNSESAPVFTMDDFALCLGPIYSGHVHTPGCFNKYFYYNGSPIRYCYGEEEEKGFIIALHNLDTHEHYTHLEPIKSFRYDTIDANELIMRDPKEVIEYLKGLHDQGIDHVRLNLTRLLSPEELNNLTIIKQYYRNNNSVAIKYDQKREEENSRVAQELSNEYEQYSYIMDKSLSPEEIITRYVNDQEGTEFITVDELIELLKEI